MPSVFDDADGRYRGFDGQIHYVTPGHHQYTALYCGTSTARSSRCST